MELTIRRLILPARRAAGLNCLASVLLALAWVLAEQSGFSQPAQAGHSAVITQIKLPNNHWKSTGQPPQLTDIFGGSGAHTKVLYQGYNQTSHLKFYVMQYDYPAQEGLDNRLAGYVDDVHQQCAQLPDSEVTVEPGTMGNLPTYEFDTTGTTNLFLKVRMVLCAQRLYLLEISGAPSAHDEGVQCLNGFSLGGETPLEAGVVDNIAAIRAPHPAPKAAVSKPGFDFLRWRRTITGIVILVVFVVVMGIAKFKRKDSDEVITAVPAAPPPALPPTEDMSTAPAWEQHVSSSRVTTSYIDNEPSTFSKVLWALAFIAALLGFVSGALIVVAMVVQHGHNLTVPKTQFTRYQVGDYVLLTMGAISTLFLLFLTLFRQSYLRWHLALQIISVIVLGVLAVPTMCIGISLLVVLYVYYVSHGKMH